MWETLSTLIWGGDDGKTWPISDEIAEPAPTDASYGGLELNGFVMPERAANESIS